MRSLQTEVSTDKSALSTFDATNFRPFSLFYRYYVNYSTPIGALFPIACAVLFVFYNGSEFINWFIVPDTFDRSIALMPTDIAFFVPGFAAHFSQSGSFSTFYNTSFFYYQVRQCTRSMNSLETTCTNITSNLPSTCTSSLCPPANAIIRSSEADPTYFTFMQIAILKCSSKIENANLTCASATEIDDLLNQGSFEYSSFDSIPSDYASQGERVKLLRSESTHWFYPNTNYLTRATMYYDLQLVQLIPSYFGNTDEFFYTLVDSISTEQVDLPSGAADEIFTLNVQFKGSLTRTRLVPVLLLLLIARVGMLMATVWIGSFFMGRINAIYFFLVATDKYYVPNYDIRKVLAANRRLDPKVYENQLFYSFTMGMTPRFGMQTKHFFQWFYQRGRRFHPSYTRSLVEDVQRFLMDKRVSEYTNEDQKVDRKVEAHYDIGAVLGKNKQKKEDSLSRMRATLQGKYNEKEQQHLIEQKSKKIAQVETTLQLMEMQDELAKMKTLCAKAFPKAARSERLAEKLSLTPSSSVFTTK